MNVVMTALQSDFLVSNELPSLIGISDQPTSPEAGRVFAATLTRLMVLIRTLCTLALAMMRASFTVDAMDRSIQK